jgi:hypothetical protein
MDTDDNLEIRRLQQQEEVESNRRIIRFMIILLVFWFAMLYFIANRDDALVIAGVVIMCLWIIYMCICIFGSYYLRFRDGWREQEALGDEDRGLTVAASKNEESLTDDETEDQSALFQYPFEETLGRIKACPYHVSPGLAPTNGVYSAVFSSIFMGKAIRNEGKIRMEFFQTRDNGWTVEGESIFSGKRFAVEDGFVNARGEMYWKTGSTIHRGNMDLSTSSMFDGEFIATETQLLTANTKPPSGRIVRLELATASFYSSSMEMVSIS